MSVLWEIPGCQHFILFCAGMKHQHFQIPGKMGQPGSVPAFLPVSPFSCWLARQCCAAPGHQTAWASSMPGRGRGLPAGLAAQGVSRESLMKPACHFWQANSSLFSKQIVTVFCFSCFNSKFYFKQGESNVPSFSVGHLINSKPERTKKCTDREAEGRPCVYAQKRWQYFLLFQDKTLFQSRVPSAGGCGKKASSSSQDKSFKIGKEKSKSFNYDFFFLLEHNWGFNFIGFIAEHSNTFCLIHIGAEVRGKKCITPVWSQYGLIQRGAEHWRLAQAYQSEREEHISTLNQ